VAAGAVVGFATSFGEAGDTVEHAAHTMAVNATAPS
jgi:hypothetical protein